MNDADKLRRNFAKYLVEDYLLDPANIAELCDTQLDKSGRLLGFVRDEADSIRGQHPNGADG